MLNIYLASSWKNIYYPSTLHMLRDVGFQVYDFRDSSSHFSWSDVDPNYKNWSMEEYLENLHNKKEVQIGFEADFNAMKECHVCVLLQPCGRSAHIEAGWVKGAGKKLIVYIPKEEKIEAELMLLMADVITQDPIELVRSLFSIYNSMGGSCQINLPKEV
jgi:hypothetical protein